MPKDTLPAYSPRWLYRFFAFLESLPVRPWALAAVVTLAVAAVTHWVAWERGVLPFGKLNLFLSVIGLFSVIGPAQWHYLTQSARPAITDFFIGRANSRQIEKTLADFVSLPPFWGTLFFALGGLSGYLGATRIMAIMLPISASVLPGLGLLASVLGGGFIFILIARIIRQSLLTRRFYLEMEVDLFNPSPIYSLSRYAVASIISLLVGTDLLQIIVLPTIMFTPLGLLSQVFLNGALWIFFVAQLLGVNGRMRRAKERLLAELGKDVERVYNDVHAAVGKKGYAAVGHMQASIATLKNEQDILQKIPTWPWQPETLRNLLTPLLIPVIVYLVQRFLGAALGF
jgi:hypothetical protein